MSEIINNGVPMNAPSNDISGYTYDTPPTYASLQDQINELKEKVAKIGGNVDARLDGTSLYLTIKG